MIELTCGPSRTLVAPETGAGLAGLWHCDRPVLRPCANPGLAGPFDLALNILAPFSNRIDHGFMFDGTRYAVPPNLAGERYPIHGDAFQRAWEVEAATERMAVLRLDVGEIGPFHYSARLTYQLLRSGLSVGLELLNRGPVTLPFGGGFHPWFPRNAGTRVSFAASGWWPEDERHLRATQTLQPSPSALRFDAGRALPDAWINVGFSGWSGQARILQGGDAVPVTLSAPVLSTLILYSPSARADFFCLEPVSHPVDAHNLPGQPGLCRLAPNETQTFTMQLDWSRDDH